MFYRLIPKRTVLFSSQDLKDVISFLLSDSIKDGECIRRFEDAFRDYVGAKEAISVSSGRFALELILGGLGLKRGDKVILSSFNFKGLPIALRNAGFVPVLIDANEETFQIAIDKIEKQIDKDTKAIIATHLFGQPCDVHRIMELAKKYNLFVVEDGAHSLGSFYKGKHVGTIGDSGFFSFTASKTVNTSFGGMVVTDNTDLAKAIRARLSSYKFPGTGYLIKERLITYVYSLVTDRTIYSLTQYPLSVIFSLFSLDFWNILNKYKPDKIGEVRTKLSNLQASTGLRQLASMKSLIDKRKIMASILINSLDKTVDIQKIPSESSPSYFMFPVKFRDKLYTYKKLLLRGVDCNYNYVTDCSIVGGKITAPVAKHLEDSILAIHLPFNLNEKEVIHLSKVINSVVN